MCIKGANAPHLPPLSFNLMTLIGSLLFFGADGAGNLFAYKVEKGEAQSGAIYQWDHEMAVWGTKEEELRYQAGSLADLIQDYYNLCYGELLPE